MVKRTDVKIQMLFKWTIVGDLAQLMVNLQLYCYWSESFKTNSQQQHSKKEIPRVTDLIYKQKSMKKIKLITTKDKSKRKGSNYAMVNENKQIG